MTLQNLEHKVPLQCEYCDEKIATRAEIAVHVENAHPEKKKPKHPKSFCEICDKFVTSLDRHQVGTFYRIKALDMAA